MKKWIIFPVLLLLLLTACRRVPVSDTEPADSAPSSGNITPPSSSVAPPTSVPPTVPTAPSIPETNPTTPSTPGVDPPEPANTGYAHIYDGKYSFTSVDPDFSGCTVGYLYWIDKATSEVTPIIEEEIFNSIKEGAYVYYVKVAEPSKIYRTLIGEFSQHELIHETVHGKVGAMVIYPGVENYLQFVADNKKFVVLDFNTGEENVLMEQCYISYAYISETNGGTLGNTIWFTGKYTEEDNPYTLFFYSRDTGETKVSTVL